MSFDATAWAWKQAKDLSSPTALVVLLCLADWVGRSGRTRWESQQDIADRCHLSVRAVGDALRTLEGAAATADQPAKPALIARTKRYQNQRRVVDQIQLLLGPTMILEGPLPSDEPPTQSADTEAESTTLSADRPVKTAPLSAPAAGMSSAPAAEQDSSESLYAPAPRPKSHEGLDVLGARIYDAAHPTAQRKSEHDPGKVIWALRELADAEPNRDLVAVANALVAYYEAPDQQKENGKYAKAPHRAVADRKWESWLGKAPRRISLEPGAAPHVPQSVTHEGRTWAVPWDGTASLVGTPDQPGIARQLSWMRDWEENTARWKAHTQGPLPGQPGCRIWPTVLAEFGVQPPETASGGQTP